MAACSNDFSPLVEQIWAFVVQDLELLAQAEHAFTSAGVETPGYCLIGCQVMLGVPPRFLIFQTSFERDVSDL